MAGKPTISDEQIAATLAETKGMLAATAKRLNVSLRTIQRRIAANEELQVIIEDQREFAIDTVELKLLELALKGNLTACIFFLKTQAKDRGYVEQLRVTDEIDNLPPDEIKRRMRAAVAKAEQREQQERMTP
jgi:predicted DNA-binding transcriptional regulator YafY